MTFAGPFGTSGPLTRVPRVRGLTRRSVRRALRAEDGALQKQASPPGVGGLAVGRRVSGSIGKEYSACCGLTARRRTIRAWCQYCGNSAGGERRPVSLDADGLSPSRVRHLTSQFPSPPPKVQSNRASRRPPVSRVVGGVPLRCGGRRSSSPPAARRWSARRVARSRAF